MLIKSQVHACIFSSVDFVGMEGVWCLRMKMILGSRISTIYWDYCGFFL